MADGHRL